jgi:hypothetical protein
MVFFISINQHIFWDKVFQTMVFSRHMQEASCCYEICGLKWSFKYSKNIMVFKTEFFYMLVKHLPGKKYHVIFQYYNFVLKLLKYFISKHPATMVRCKAAKQLFFLLPFDIDRTSVGSLWSNKKCISATRYNQHFQTCLMFCNFFPDLSIGNDYHQAL